MIVGSDGAPLSKRTGSESATNARGGGAKKNGMPIRHAVFFVVMQAKSVGGQGSSTDVRLNRSYFRVSTSTSGA